MKYHNVNFHDPSLPVKNVPHCIFGPADTIDGIDYYYLNGELIGTNLSKKEFNKIKQDFYNKTSRYYLKDGAILNSDEYAKLCKELYPNSVNPVVPSKSLHRLDGPAQDLFYRKEYNIDGIAHRDNGPARINSDGDFYHYKYGKLHNENGPAAYVSGDGGGYAYYIDNLKHRINGPAIIMNSGKEQWFYKGKQIHCTNIDEFHKIIIFA